MKDIKPFKNIAEDIVNIPNYQQLKQYWQHKTNLYDHSYHVGYLSFKWAVRLNLDYVSATRGALLHDYFLYDWRIESQKKRDSFFQQHGFEHPKTALKNAKRDYNINGIESDIILHHMFPLTISPPKTMEGWLVNIMDTIVTIYEYTPFYHQPTHF